MGKFQEFMVEEGFLGCVGHGVKEGWKAFAKKRSEEQKETEKTELSRKILAAEGDQLKRLIKQMVEKNLTLDKEGKVKDEQGIKDIQTPATAWLGEHVRSQRRSESSQGL